jgi:hypothetical protein
MRLLSACLLWGAILSGSEVRGTIQIKCKYEEFKLGMGCWGPNRSQVPTTVLGVGCAMPLENLPEKAGGYHWGWDRGLDLRWEPKKGLTFHVNNTAPGWHVVATNWQEGHYYDWKWFEVPEDPERKTESEINLTIDPSVTGSAEVTVRPSKEGSPISFMFANDAGKVPSWWPRPIGDPVSESVKNGKAVFKGLHPGKYVFYVPPPVDSIDPPKIAVGAEVKAQTMTKIELAEKN